MEFLCCSYCCSYAWCLSCKKWWDTCVQRCKDPISYYFKLSSLYCSSVAFFCLCISPRHVGLISCYVSILSWNIVACCSSIFLNIKRWPSHKPLSEHQGWSWNNWNGRSSCRSACWSCRVWASWRCGSSWGQWWSWSEVTAVDDEAWRKRKGKIDKYLSWYKCVQLHTRTFKDTHIFLAKDFHDFITEAMLGLAAPRYMTDSRVSLGLWIFARKHQLIDQG